MGLLDIALEDEDPILDDELEASEDLTEPQQKLVTGTFAVAAAPKITLEKKSKSLMDIVAEDDFGKSPAKQQILYDGKEVKDIVTKPKSLMDIAVEDENKPSVFLMGEDPITNLAIRTKEGVVGLGKTALEVMSVDENLIVAGMSKVAGYPSKKNFSDYTYTNFLLDTGLPDTVGTHALGVALSIYGSPLSYLTFGSTGVAKLGAQGARLTNKGLELASAIKKERLGVAIEKASVKQHHRFIDGVLTRDELTDTQISKLQSKISKDVDNELINKFQVLKKQTQTIEQGKDVAKLGNSVFDLSGISLQVPFTSTKYNVVEGSTIAKIVHETALPRINKALAKVEAVAPTLVKTVKALKDEFGKVFIPNYGRPAELLDIIEETIDESRRIKAASLKEVETFFKGLTPSQREDFTETALSYNREYPNVQVYIETITKDALVQDRLDKFYSQGVYTGEKSWPTMMKERLGPYAKLIEDTERPNWFPGIVPDATLESLNIKDYFRNFKFLREPKGIVFSSYTRDPIQALSVRSTQIAFARLQEEAYKKAVKNGYGGMIDAKTYNSLSSAMQDEYVSFKSPIASYLLNKQDDVSRAKEATFYTKRDYKDAWDEGFSDERNIPQGALFSLLNDANTIFKKSVTLLFPAYYARNFTSNIVFNAYSIGGQAFNPKQFKLAADAIRGKDTYRQLITESGERVTLKSLVDEAKIHEVTGIQGLFFDLAGEKLKGQAKSAWELTKSRFNPLSPDAFLFGAGMKFNSAIEDQARFVNYLHWRMKGLDPKLAAMEAKDALLDYNKITKSERKWGSFLIPFYSFQKKNLEKHIRIFAHRPAFTMDFVNMMAEFGPTQNDWEGLPKWLKNKINIKFGDLIFSGFGFGIEDALQNLTFDERLMAGKVNPLVRIGFERLANRELVSGRALHSVNAAQEFKFAVEWAEDNKNPIRNMIGKSIVDTFDLIRDPSSKGKEKVIGNAHILHLTRALPTARWQSVLNYIQKEDETLVKTMLRLSLGLYVLTPDQEKMVAYARAEVAREGAFESVLKNVGFEIPYIVAKDKRNQEYLNKYVNNIQKEKGKYKNMGALERLKERREDRFERMVERRSRPY